MTYRAHGACVRVASPMVHRYNELLALLFSCLVSCCASSSLFNSFTLTTIMPAGAVISLEHVSSAISQEIKSKVQLVAGIKKTGIGGERTIS